MPRPCVSTAAVVASVAVVLSACGGTSTTPAPSPSAEPLRPVAACDTTVVVPAESQQVEASATTPSTVVLSVGQAFGFTAPAGARVGLTGAPDAELDAQLCAAPVDPADATGAVLFVAAAPGDLAVGVQVGIGAVERIFVKVTG